MDCGGGCSTNFSNHMGWVVFILFPICNELGLELGLLLGFIFQLKLDRGGFETVLFS